VKLTTKDIHALIEFADEGDYHDGCTAWGPKFDAIMQVARRVREDARKELRESYDDCVVCLGTRGGVKGNENVINDVIMCDHCTVDQIKNLKGDD